MEERIITSKQLEEGLAKQRELGCFLGQALVELGHIDQDTLTLVLVKQCKIPHLNILEYAINDEMLGLIPPELCEKYRVLPVDKMGKILTVAMVDPLDVEALNAIRLAFPDLRIKPILCDWPHFQEVSRRLTQLTKPSAPQVFEAPVSLPPAPAKKESAPAAAAAEKGQAAPSKPAAAPQAVSEAKTIQHAAPIDTEALKEAIREGVQETMGMFEQRLSEASELLRAVQATEKSVVESRVKQDLGVAEPETSARRFERVVALAPQSATADGDQGVRDDLERGTPRTVYTFESFIAGPANSSIVEIAKAVAKGGGGEYNPLFVCGDVGLGKTHLVSAIGNALIAAGKPRVGWTSASRFADHTLAAREEKAQEVFRQAYSTCDALIVDDIQFLGGRVEAQEELFHVFNALQERGRTIVIAGDRMPEKLGLLEKRLVSRFDSGQVAMIRAPEWETRIKILKRHAGQLKTNAPDEVLAMIAMRHPNDVRRLIGALRKLAAHAKLKGGALSAALASELLGGEGGAEAAA